MAALFAFFAAILVLPVLAIGLGLVQLGWYRLRRTPADDVPFFLILMLRGMIVGLAMVAAGAVASHFISRKISQPNAQTNAQHQSPAR